MREKKSELQMPLPEQGFVQTLNRMGFMTVGLDPVSQAFVDFSGHAPGPALDIGAAYGVASLAALEAGGRVIANDLDSGHLEILRERVPPALRSKLDLKPGRFPEELQLAEGSLGCALLCRVLHFFSPPDLVAAAGRLYFWLAPGAKAFVVCETPYVRTLKELIPLYEERMRAGAEWPGYFEDIHAVNPGLAAKLPAAMHLLDPHVLARVFTGAGFQVESARLLARPDFPDWLQWDGRESVGLIATKRASG